jgi:predicted AlkP superfamily pyrophosphatase or phosphodiesterase
MYNPDAIAQWLFRKYKPDFAPVLAHTQLALPLKTMVPPKTPVCFATMYTGAEPSVHGIVKPERVVLKIDTLFDALARAGKRAAIVAMQKSSMSILFGGRDIDYFILPDDAAVLKKALQLIEANQHDFMAVYHEEYDDTMHATQPESPESLAAMRKHIASFAALAEATDKAWAGYDRLIGFAPDHGVHTGADGRGTHGEEIPEDMNITHFYGIHSRV